MSPEERCPRAADHTPAPVGYPAFAAWADAMQGTHRQVRCSGCGLYEVWIPRVPGKLPRPPEEFALACMVIPREGPVTGTSPVPEIPETGTSLRDQLSAAIRAAVRLRIGPNSLTVAENGNTLLLNLGEAETAADAALAVMAPELEERDTEIARLRALLPALIKVAAHVSRGRSAVDVEPYPDALARRALGVVADAGLLPEEGSDE